MHKRKQDMCVRNKLDLLSRDVGQLEVLKGVMRRTENKSEALNAGPFGWRILRSGYSTPRSRFVISKVHRSTSMLEGHTQIAASTTIPHPAL